MDFESLEDDLPVDTEQDNLFFHIGGDDIGGSGPKVPSDPTDRDAPGGSDRRASVEDELDEDPGCVEDFPGVAQVYREDMEASSQYALLSHSKQNPYHPFTNQMEWKLAKWAKDTQQGRTGLAKLLSVPGVAHCLSLTFHNARALNQVIDHELPCHPPLRKVPICLAGTHETFHLYHCNVMECIHELWRRPLLCVNQMYAPQKHFTDNRDCDQLRNELNTGEWWWKTQLKLPHSMTVIPIIFSSDKTQLSVFSGDHSTYPVYMTIGNIPKPMRCKPSSGAQVLVGYLPTVDLEASDLSIQAAHIAPAHLFYKAMGVIVQSIIDPGKDGVMLTGADGKVRKCFPILACYVADYQEQCLVACTQYGATDPKSHTTKADFGANQTGYPRLTAETLRDLKEAQQIPTHSAATNFLKQVGLIDVPEPFWAPLPHTDIHEVLTPNILHQLYQGLVKHVIRWLEKIIGPTKLDARIQHLPPAHALCHFKDGITHLTHVSGTEHKQMCKQILGCIIGVVPVEVVKATCALLDFVYLAQCKNHSQETFKFLQHALNEFHRYKAVFLKVGARSANNMNLPKLKLLQHYVCSINLFRTTDNYNMEAAECLHIDYAKDTFQATNKKEDYIKQMTLWLERCEKVYSFASHVDWHLNGQTTHTTQRPNTPNTLAVAFNTLAHAYGATSFPHWSFVQPVDINLLRQSINVWWRLKFCNANLWLPSIKQLEDTVHATPTRTTRASQVHHAQFDTILVQHSPGHSTGIKGVCQLFQGSKLGPPF
ncbi:hypothetical protein K439DRAFT_1618211 [Ramaria rubella]|nr:hypothetical protein K439DRAFT_1618211 [Ramaria rubella]